MGVCKHSGQLYFTGTEIYRFEVFIGCNAFFKNCGKMGKEAIRFCFIPNKLDLTFRALNHCAKFHQNRIKIAAVGVFSDRLTE